jgi:hypothetical protein
MSDNAVRVAEERSSDDMEMALKDGRCVRMEADTDPEAVRRLVTLLEGAAS